MDQLMIGYGVSDTSAASAPPSSFYSSNISPTQSDNSIGKYNTVKKELTLSEKQEMAANLEKQNEANGFGAMTSSKSLQNVAKKAPKSNVDLLTNDLFDKNLTTLSIKPPPPPPSSKPANAATSNFDLLTKSPTSGATTGFPSMQPSQGMSMSQSSSFGFPATSTSMNNSMNFSSNGSNQSMFNTMNSSMKPAPNYNINSNGNANMGFFGNLALPAPTTSPSQPLMGNNNSSLNNLGKSSPMSMMNQPLIPSKAPGNVAPSGKKNALDDLADFLG